MKKARIDKIADRVDPVNRPTIPNTAGPMEADTLLDRLRKPKNSDARLRGTIWLKTERATAWLPP